MANREFFCTLAESNRLKQNEQTMPKILHIDYVSKTKIRQAVVAIASLILGSGIIASFVSVAPLVGLGDFGLVAAIVSGLELLVTLYYSSLGQLEDELAGPDLFKIGLAFGLGGGMLFSLLFALILLIDGFDWGIFVRWSGYILLLCLLVGMAVSSVQTLCLLVFKVSLAEHRRHTNSQAEASACRQGELPYRQRVRFFWTIVFNILVGILAGGVGLFLLGKKSCGAFLFCCVGALAAFYLADKYRETLSSPRIGSVEGQVIKTSQRVYRATIWQLRCSGSKIKADRGLWERIVDDQFYRIWYVWIGRGQQAIAYELLNPNPRDAQPRAGTWSR